MSCGDEKIDALLASGIVKSLKSCCNAGIYGDHVVDIVMKNGTTIKSESGQFTNVLTLQPIYNRNPYTRLVENGESCSNMILNIAKQMGLNHNNNVKQQNTVTYRQGKEIISQETFERAYNFLVPLDLQIALDKRTEPSKVDSMQTMGPNQYMFNIKHM